MNFLQLAQRTRRKCRIAGTGPTAVTGQTEEYSRVLDWVNEAWMIIQRKHEEAWLFMRANCSAQTVNGQAAYGAAEFNLTDLGRFALNYANGDSFRVYNTAQGVASETFMDVIDYDDWRDTYQIGALRNAFMRPSSVAVGPDGKLYCGPITSAGWTIIGEYYRLPSEMAAAGDIPSLPAQYHMAIVYRAMMLYGVSEAAAEVYQDGQNAFDTIMREIERTQLPPMRLAGALA
jgi:hypothetical protein